MPVPCPRCRKPACDFSRLRCTVPACELREAVSLDPGAMNAHAERASYRQPDVARCGDERVPVHAPEMTDVAA